MCYLMAPELTSPILTDPPPESKRSFWVQLEKDIHYGLSIGKVFTNNFDIFNPTWYLLSSPSPYLECFYSIWICQRPTYQSFSLLKLA